ncbi:MULTISPECIES: hypothetical protein [unclassified Roseofilum]|uniref:hypothetical protein n=1 Tax=unclassified Roseofilum TaxID=2620099 RepID=UPI000E85A367|nr:MULTISPECIES: hypothetical protein [unclassified Roseofilum]MBP0008629.1 hypothetical protein [Roseofilum sp. Belize Diploria]MBP0032228.1 hypothetical protein [Roseofilum sp. Belize BBD 4]HBQ97261.1 hypothetical protein [Cyanobacteria bacterium UBA11691]
MIDYYKGWIIQVFFDEQYWHVDLISPKGDYSGMGCLVGIHFDPFSALQEARDRIDRRNAWTSLEQVLAEFRDCGLISDTEWDYLRDSLTCWVVQ